MKLERTKKEETMRDREAQDFVQYCELNHPDVREWKFKPTNQLGVLLLKDGKGYKYEVHLHYAAMGNGVLTGANVRWEGEASGDSVVLDTGSRLVKYCDEYLRAGINENFARNMGTTDRI